MKLISREQAVHALLHGAGQAAFNRATNQPEAASGQPGQASYRQPNGPLVSLKLGAKRSEFLLCSLKMAIFQVHCSCCLHIVKMKSV
jgi:hypothetical protein